MQGTTVAVRLETGMQCLVFDFAACLCTGPRIPDRRKAASTWKQQNRCQYPTSHRKVESWYPAEDVAGSRALEESLSLRAAARSLSEDRTSHSGHACRQGNAYLCSNCRCNRRTERSVEQCNRHEHRQDEGFLYRCLSGCHCQCKLVPGDQLCQ
eukprot:3379458-Rhodomonas_salina.1